MLASSRIASIFNLIRYYEIHLITFYPDKDKLLDYQFVDTVATPEDVQDGKKFIPVEES